MLLLQVLPPPVQTEIHFGSPVEICLNLSKKGAILVDEKIAGTHGIKLQKALNYDLISVPSSKSRESKQKVEDELCKKKIGKDALLVALGGGSTTDLVAFIASTYLRGTPLVLIPTTLLAMVDAAIGGKTGVDTPYGKNLVGSLYLPKAVCIDVSFLKTLSEKEMKNGLSEILKYGLIDNPAIWRAKEINRDLIRASIEVKLKIVREDFDEKLGLRHILNFGHTVGHALELITNFEMSHGEAVALGCMAESFLSYRLGYLCQKDFEEILDRYQKLGYRFKKFDKKRFFDALTMDKKAKEGKPRFVILEKIGKCAPFDGKYCTLVDPIDLEKMVEWMSGH